MTTTETDAELRQRILVIAARKMRDFGYLDVQPDDIMGEYVLRIFLKLILEDDENVSVRLPQFQRVRLSMLEEIASAKSDMPPFAKRERKPGRKG